MSYAVSWSGGKDGCFACYKAMIGAHKIDWLVNSISDDHERVRFHGTEAKLIQLQSEALGVQLVQNRTSAERYEEDFKAAIRPLIEQGLEGMIFGDIYVQQNRDWVEKVCRDLGVEALLPVWGRDPQELLLEFIDTGFEAVVVGANAEMVDKKWIGRKVDREFLCWLEANNVDPCGENGEYHSFVTDGPIFKRPVKIKDSRTVRINGYWFLDTLDYALQRQ